MVPKNIFKNIPHILENELFETLVLSENVKIERIVSKGHQSPPNYWYDQDQNEWVMIVQGEAKLRLQQKSQEIHLKAGEYFYIPAHIKHRVEWTPSDIETIWLAVFF